MAAGAFVGGLAPTCLLSVVCLAACLGGLAPKSLLSVACFILAALCSVSPSVLA